MARELRWRGRRYLGSWAWDLERWALREGSAAGSTETSEGRYCLGLQLAAMELRGKMPISAWPRNMEPELPLARLHVTILVDRFLSDGEALPTDFAAAFEELRADNGV